MFKAIPRRHWGTDLPGRGSHRKRYSPRETRPVGPHEILEQHCEQTDFKIGQLARCLCNAPVGPCLLQQVTIFLGFTPPLEIWTTGSPRTLFQVTVPFPQFLYSFGEWQAVFSSPVQKSKHDQLLLPFTRDERTLRDFNSSVRMRSG